MKTSNNNLLTLIQRILAFFDIGIYRVSKSKPNAQGFQINDPVEHNSMEMVNRFYSDPELVKNYLSEERTNFYEKLIDFVIDKNISFSTNMLVAEVGCGPGFLLAILEKRFPFLSLTGFEKSIKAIEVGRKICQSANFSLFDIYEGSSEKYDLVFCTEVLEHLEYPERAMKTLLSMIKPMGHVILTVPNGRTDTFLGHINFWSPESWKIFIDQNSSDYSKEVFLWESKNLALLKNGAHVKKGVGV